MVLAESFEKSCVIDRKCGESLFTGWIKHWLYKHNNLHFCLRGFFFRFFFFLKLFICLSRLTLELCKILWSISVFNYISTYTKKCRWAISLSQSHSNGWKGLVIFSGILCLCLQAVKNWFISLLWQWSPLESQISIGLLGALAQVTANVIIILIQFAYFNKYKLVVRASVREQWAKWRRWKDHNCHLANFKRHSCFFRFCRETYDWFKEKIIYKMIY